MHQITPEPPTWFNWLTVAAIVAGPILALLTQRLLDFLRDKRAQRLQLFMTLISTRAAQLAPDHIKALNSIDIVFDRNSDKRVRDAWHAALRQLTADPTQPDWQERVNDLKVDLYREIGSRVGYDYTTDYLKRQAYLPRFYGELDADNLRLRKTLLNALTDAGLKIVPGDSIGRAAQAEKGST